MDDLTQRIDSLSPAKRKLLESRLKKKNQGFLFQLPTILPASEQKHLPFPLTDIQQAYWIGRTGSFELGSVTAHLYREVEGIDLDLNRLNHALQQLIERHDMLRAIVLPDGQQQILPQVTPYHIEVLDLRGQEANVIESELEDLRGRMSHQVLPSDKWPLFEVRASRLDDRRFRLHISFDALTFDGWSILLIFNEWSRLYQDTDANLDPLELSFRDYVLGEEGLRESELYQRSQDYWLRRLDTLPPAPELPLEVNPSSVLKPRFVRRDAKLQPETWARLKDRAARAGLTPSGVLLAAYAETLKAWSKNPRFTLTLTLFNRLPIHPQVNDIVGDFTSLSLLEVDNSREDTFEARARFLQEQFWEDLDHRHFSGVRVLREFSKNRGGVLRASMPVVFTSILTHDTTKIGGQYSTEWIGDTVYEITQTPQVWLDQIVSEEDGVMVFKWDAVEELFPQGLLDDMFDAYNRLLHRLANEEKSWQESWPQTVQKLIPTTQLEQWAAINTTETPTTDKLLHTLFAEQVTQRPDQLAVVASNRTMTYEELHSRANQVGGRIRQLGARPNTLVAVVMEKGWEQVVAVLGVLVSGAAYLPLDPNLPKERLFYLLEHGEVEIALTQSCFDESLEWPEGVERLCLDDEKLNDTYDLPLDPVQEDEDLAYVIYTSGSTGQPKGVMIDHRGAVNTILDINERFGVGPQDRVLALSSLSFDLSVYDIFGILVAGGTIVIPEDSGTRDPSHWAQLITAEKVTIWNTVPALMNLLIEYVTDHPHLIPRSLRTVLLSGDWIPVTLPDSIKALIEDVKVISLGGATEASIWSILYPIEAVDPGWKSIPYGKPMVNQRFHVLGEDLEPRPLWVAGGLYIGGIGLAKGYWRDEEKTDFSFITHPRSGERLYRTGDLGRYLPDGNIEFLGREDFQVKAQGYRVELGEIETNLVGHPGVREAVVTASGEQRGEKRLVAYAVPGGPPQPTVAELRTFLQQKLPDYMLPSAFVLLDELPLTPNGKVDRKALPQPKDRGFEQLGSSSVEETGLITRISQLVTKVLEIDALDPQANLLNLGATSIDMIRIANLLDKELNFRPKMDDFYRQPTVLELAESYEHYLLASPGTEGPTELTSFKLILDPEEREGFKQEQPGLRKGDGEKSSIQLMMTQSDEALRKRYRERCSHRRFSSEPIPLDQFSGFISPLYQIKLDDKPKYLYASAGGLYPIQTYLYIKPGRVEGLSAGIYYYHPVDHRLLLLSENVDLDPAIHDPLVNRPVFDESAFSIFLIAQLGAIAPMYGDRSMHFATIEAGLIAQLLESWAPTYGIGLCQIGVLEFEPIRRLFDLEESHILIHSLVGGRIEEGGSTRWSPFQEDYYQPEGSAGEREEGEL